MCVRVWLCACGFLCVGVLSSAPADGRFRGGRRVDVGSPALFKWFCLANCVFVFWICWGMPSLHSDVFTNNAGDAFVSTPVFLAWGARAIIGAEQQFYPSVTLVCQWLFQGSLSHMATVSTGVCGDKHRNLIFLQSKSSKSLHIFTH